MLFLSSAYFLYSSFVVPFTVARQVPEHELSVQVTGYQPPVLSDTAAKYFADVTWLQSGNIKTFQSQETFFYTQEVERDANSGNQVRMSPIAILWKDPRRPDERPFRIIAEKGIIQFENQFFDTALQLTDVKPGRIVWGTLEGLVHIDGPDGLQIDGQQFVFSEKSGQLYSDYSVSFRYGPTQNDRTEVAGTADKLNISLTPSEDPVLGRDMPRVAGVSVITLRQNVELAATFFQEGVRHQARLTCDGPFEYDAIKKLAAFNNRVRVIHKEPVGVRLLTDLLESEQLALQFVAATPPSQLPGVKTDAPSGKMFDDLVLKQVEALGSTAGLGGRSSQVHVQSEKHDLNATMQQLRYDFLDRFATFVDPQQVVAKRGDTTFSCPVVSFRHSPENQLERLNCKGPGRLFVAHERLAGARAEASWEGQVNVIPDDSSSDHIVELLQNSQVIFPGVPNEAGQRDYEVGIAANELRLWVDLDKAQRFKASAEALNSPLPISRAEAAGDVALVSRDLVVEKSERVNVYLTPAETVSAASEEVIGASYEDEQGRTSAQKPERQPIRIGSDQIRLDLTHNPHSGQVALKRVDGMGHVKISHQPNASRSLQRLGGESPIVLRGTRVIGESSGVDNHQVTLFGILDEFGKVQTPAEMSFGPTRIMGANLTFDRSKNQVAILGPGAFQIPVTRDLNGAALDEPATLEVVWQERMTFDGLDANFLEAVSCSLKGHQESISRMNCEDLSVRLNQKISFSEKPDTSQKTDIESIFARHGVKLETYEYEGTNLVAVHRGKLAEFNVNQQTGNFVGLGPGEVHSWSRGNSLKLAPNDTAQANQPIESEKSPEWRYTCLEFSGKLTGNFEQQIAEFERQRIRILSAPVEQSLIKFDEDNVSKVSNAVRLDCRTLKIFQKQFNDRAYWELFAQNVNELEGQVFRAVADELSFDERLGRFILRGIGKDATLYFQERPGASFSPSSHRLIEFIPKKRSITVDGSSGLGT